MNNKPDLSEFRISTQNQILINTLMEMADKFKLICSGLENCDWSEVICVPPDGPEYSRYNLSGDTWAELMDLVSIYIAAHPKLEWLSPSEKQYISEHGFRYTKEEKKKYWNTMGMGASDYMSEWHKVHLGETCENHEDRV